MAALVRALALCALFLFPLLATAPAAAKDLRTKQQRLYDIKLRNAQWEVDRKQLDRETTLSAYEETKDLFARKIRTLEDLNRTERAYRRAQLAFDQAQNALENVRLAFLRDATRIAILEAKTYRTPDGRRRVDITLQNASNLEQAASLNPDKSVERVRALLQIQDIRVAIEDGGGRVVAAPYETTVEALDLGESRTLSYRLLEDLNPVTVALRTADNRREAHHIMLRGEALQDVPTVRSLQFSQEGDLNTKVSYDLVLERLAEDEKTFRLAVVNLPREIDIAFVDPATGANLTQVKFDDDRTRQQLNLELRIPEKLSRRYVDRTVEFYVFVTEREGFAQIGALNRRFGGEDAPLDEINAVDGNKERFELIPRGKGALEAVVANRYYEIRNDETVQVRLNLLNTGTLEIEQVHLRLTPPLDWSWSAMPDTIDRIAPGEEEPVTVSLVPPAGLGVSEYDVRIEAAAFIGNEKVEAVEKDIVVRVEEKADLLRNALVICAVIALVVGVAVFSVKASRR